MDIVGINGFRAVARVAVITAATTLLSGFAWAQYSSGPSGSGPHTGPSSDTMGASEMAPSGAGQGIESCSPNAAAVGYHCAQSSGGSGTVAPSSSDEGGVNVNELETKPRNDKIPSRRTDE